MPDTLQDAPELGIYWVMWSEHCSYKALQLQKVGASPWDTAEGGETALGGEGG